MPGQTKNTPTERSICARNSSKYGSRSDRISSPFAALYGIVISDDCMQNQPKGTPCDNAEWLPRHSKKGSRGTISERFEDDARVYSQNEAGNCEVRAGISGRRLLKHVGQNELPLCQDSGRTIAVTGALTNLAGNSEGMNALQRCI
jgi:hypothetical protein